MSRRWILVFAFLALTLAAGTVLAAAATCPNAAGMLPPASIGSAPGATGPTLLPGERSYPELAGWPATLGVNPNYAPGEGPATVDINGDGRLEVFAASTDAKLYGWKIDGTPLPGFPVTLNGKAQSSPAVGDIDGDGVPEILVATTGGYAYAFKANGTPVTGWPAVPVREYWLLAPTPPPPATTEPVRE